MIHAIQIHVDLTQFAMSLTERRLVHVSKDLGKFLIAIDAIHRLAVQRCFVLAENVLKIFVHHFVGQMQVAMSLMELWSVSVIFRGQTAILLVIALHLLLFLRMSLQHCWDKFILNFFIKFLSTFRNKSLFVFKINSQKIIKIFN
jgi:hypothetical protein